MSYCRGIIYVIRDPGGQFICFSPLHSAPFHTDSRVFMVRHLKEHQEDADEIILSINKAVGRLEEEILAGIDA